jgi:hypothetical protein
VKVLAYGAGRGWIVEQARALQKLFPGPIFVDPKGPAGAHIPMLQDAGIWIEPITTDDLCDAAALVLDLTEAGQLDHFDQAELEAAVQVAAWRPVGDRRAFGRRASGGDISPLEAVSIAALKAQVSEYDLMASGY